MKLKWKKMVKTIGSFFLRNEVLRNWVRGSYLKRRLAFPSMVQVEITNACNAKCTMCPHQKMSRKIENIEIGLFEKIVKECANNSQYVLTFLPNHFGEPLLNPHLPEYIKYVKKNLPKVETAIFTNGSLLNEGKSIELINAGLDMINVSFDGFSKDTYEKIRIGLKFNEVNENILNFINLKKQMKRKKPFINLAFIAMSENVSEVSDFIKKWESLADAVSIGTFCNWGGEVIGEAVTSRQNTGRNPCTRLWSHMLIFVNGNVPLCCQDYNGNYILGNIYKQTLKEIWQGEIIKEYRRLHSEGKFYELPICRNCNFWEQQNEPIWWWG